MSRFFALLSITIISLCLGSLSAADKLGEDDEKLAIKAKLQAKLDFTKWEGALDNDSLNGIVDNWRSHKSEPFKKEILLLLLKRSGSRDFRRITLEIIKGQKVIRTFHEGQLAVSAINAILKVQLPSMKNDMNSQEVAAFRLSVYEQVIRAMNLSHDCQEGTIDLSLFNDSGKKKVASARDTPAATLRKLATEKNVEIRLEVAKNMNTPLDIIMAMSKKDTSPQVRKVALGNLMHAREVSTTEHQRISPKNKETVKPQKPPPSEEEKNQ